jgi:hypothetical protein
MPRQTRNLQGPRVSPGFGEKRVPPGVGGRPLIDRLTDSGGLPVAPPARMGAAGPGLSYGPGASTKNML